MIHIPHTTAPSLKYQALKKLFHEKLPEINSLLEFISAQADKISDCREAFSINHAFREGAAATQKLGHLLQELIDKNVSRIEKGFLKDKDHSQQQVDELSKKLTKERSDYDSRWVDRSFGTVATLGIYTLIEGFSELGRLIDDGDSYKSPGQRMLAAISSMEGSLRNANEDLSKLTAFEKDFSAAENFTLSQLYFPGIFLLIAGHGIKIHAELLRNCQNHSVVPDEVINYLENTDAVCANALLSLLKADYKTDDLYTLLQYAGKAHITNSPAQRALLQFINHTVTIHFDFFEIWASKVSDLQNKEQEITKIIGKNSVRNLPALEILHQTPVQLSKITDDQQCPAVADTPGTANAIKFALSAGDEAQKKVIALIQCLRDPANGNLKERHSFAMNASMKEIQKFSGFFNGIEKTLKQAEVVLNQKTGELAKTWQLYAGAEAISNQIELLNFNSPQKMRAFKRKLLWSSAGARLLGGDISVLGELLSGGIQNKLTNDRYKEEFRIRMNSLLKRQNGNPDDLKKTLDALEAEIEKLLENKDFLSFLSNGNLDHVRTVYMILTRLVAGEANVDAMEQYTAASGFTTLDEFIDAAKIMNVRLAQALENFIYGFADSNDLEVIIAEGNSKKQITCRVQQLIEDFSDEIIKPHFSDFARQASIVDYLQMRNALYTGHSFHSFGEVVKKNDPALLALLSGQGDFILTGNNNVHELFGHYLCRHGERTFIDLHDRNNRKPKVIMLSPAEDLRLKNREIATARNEGTLVPRLGNVFIELCTYEYMLSHGANIVKNKKLIAHPYVLGAMEMINDTMQFIIEKLSIMPACRFLAEKNNSSINQTRLGNLLEGLIADSCIQFFSELGALHRANALVQDKIRMVKNSFSGENFSLPHSLYTKMITNDAKQRFQLFIEIYQQTLEAFLKTSTCANKKIFLQQLSEVEPIMKYIQPLANTTWPDSEQALLKAYYRDHSLSYVSINRATWSIRSAAISMTA